MTRTGLIRAMAKIIVVGPYCKVFCCSKSKFIQNLVSVKIVLEVVFISLFFLVLYFAYFERQRGRENERGLSTHVSFNAVCAGLEK